MLYNQFSLFCLVLLLSFFFFVAHIPLKIAKNVKLILNFFSLSNISKKVTLSLSKFLKTQNLKARLFDLKKFKGL